MSRQILKTIVTCVECGTIFDHYSRTGGVPKQYCERCVAKKQQSYVKKRNKRVSEHTKAIKMA